MTPPAAPVPFHRARSVKGMEGAYGGGLGFAGGQRQRSQGRDGGVTTTAEGLNSNMDTMNKKADKKLEKTPSQLISERIAELGDWRGETLDHVRKLIREADP